MTVVHPLRDVTLENLRRRTSMKWSAYDAGVIPMWVAEMDVALAEPVARAITDAVARGDTGYPHGTGYAEAYAGFAERRWGFGGLEPARSAQVADVMTGIVEMVGLVSQAGDPVVLNPPVYPPFYGYLEHAGRTVVEAPLGDDGRLDLAGLEAAFVRAGAGGRPVSYLLCNPHNPTAVVHTATELAAVAALAARHRVRVVVDEIHAPLVPSGFVPYLSVPGADDAFGIVSASKAWNLAGTKAAVAFAGPAAAADLARLPEVVGHGPSHLGVLAHTAALRDGVDWLDGLHADLDANRDLLSALLAEHLPGVRWQRGDGTYLAWLDARALGLGDDPAEVLLDKARVALNSGLPFGTGGAGHMRLNYATSRAILTEALERLGSALTD